MAYEMPPFASPSLSSPARGGGGPPSGGGGGGRAHDGRYDKCRPTLHIIGRKPQYTDTFLRQPFGTPAVIVLPLGMNRAIDLDAKLRLGAIEVQHKWTDRVLSTKM